MFKSRDALCLKRPGGDCEAERSRETEIRIRCVDASMLWGLSVPSHWANNLFKVTAAAKAVAVTSIQVLIETVQYASVRSQMEA